jgi:hypothetical protein
MNNNKTNKLSAIFSILLSVFTLQAQSDCGSFEDFVDNKDGTVTDPRFGTVWKRCAEGEEFDGKTCRGKATSMKTWFDAIEAAKASQFLGKGDWRLPTLTEFYAITGHKPGLFTECKRGYMNAPEEGIAVSKMLSANGYYWSTTLKKNQESGNTIKGTEFYEMDFVTGEFRSVAADVNLAVRLVRAGVPSPISDGKLDKQFEFDREYETFYLPALKRLTSMDKAFQKILNDKDPQAMYLAAGKARIPEARSIYEAIISRFPNSPFAVKASDQLNNFDAAYSKGLRTLAEDSERGAQKTRGELDDFHRQRAAQENQANQDEANRRWANDPMNPANGHMRGQ